MAASETSCTTKAASLTAAVSAPAKHDRSRIKKSAAPAPPRSLVGASSAVGQQQRQPLQRSAHAGSVVSCPPGATGAGPRALSDDCAIDDLLEGRMDLRLVLPDGREVLVNVERRTPVMDLLVQVATAHKINPSGHFVQAPSERGDMLTCKPNTAIGSLDVSHLLIVPKGAPPMAGGAADLAFWQRKGMRPSSKPFEPTQRIQVRLPRNQLMVQRLPLTTTLGELRQSVCTEKGLDPQGYQLVRPSMPTRALDLGCTLHEYGASEVALLSNRTLAVNIQNSTADIMSYSLNQDNKRGSHVFPQHSGSKGSLTGSSSDGASSRGTSPTRSELPVVFSRPATKKRPAPPPPLPASPPPPTIPEQEPEESTTTLGTKGGRREGGGHSRQSSDSSGYHEASVLSDLPDTPSPEAVQGRPNCSMARQESPSQTSATTEVVMHRRSAPVECSSRPVRPQSTISEAGTISHGKKRKAPPPPPLALKPPSPAPKHAPVEGSKPVCAEPAASSDTPEARLAEPSPPAADEKGEQRECIGDIGLLPPPSPFFAAPASPPGSGHSNMEPPVPKPHLLTIPLWQPAPEDNEPKEFDEASAAYKRMVFSRIDATFDSIEDSDSLAVDNSACVSDSASWEYTIPEPPSPFRTRACGESESQEASPDAIQAQTKTEETEPEPTRSDLSRDDSGLPDDLSSRDDAAKVTTELNSDSSTDQDKSKCEENSVRISVSTVAVTSYVELSVPQEETGQHQSSSAKEEEARKPEDQSEAHSDNQSSETPSVSVAAVEKSPLSQSKLPDPDQESDEDAAVVAHEPIPRRDSLQIYRLKEVKVSSQHTESLAPGEQQEEQHAAEPTLETGTQKENIVALSSAPEEEVVIPVAAACQEPKKSLAKAAVEIATSEQPHMSSSNSNLSKEKHQASEDSQDTAQTEVIDRRELVKMSSYPSASEARVEASKVARGASGKDSLQAEESDTVVQQEIKVTRRQHDVERTPRPISFSIGSYGSYKTEVVDVDNIYSGETLKPNYERFKNIKVVSPSNAKSSTQAAAASKVPAAPAVGSATSTRSDGKHSHNGETTITVKIGRQETSEPKLEHGSKQSVSTVDLRPGQHTVSQSSEAGQLQFEEEKDNLLSEYTKLQEQFVVWQQQLASNQNMLEDKKIVPSTVALSTSELQQSQVRGDSAVIGGQHNARVSTLPRAKPVRPLSLVEERSRAFKQQGSTECATAPVVVNFGTWKDKREERSVVSTTTTFSRQRSVGSCELTEEKTSKCNADSTKTAQSNVKQYPKPVPKKPTGILYAAPTVRGFSQEAIEKLSQEASLQHKPVQPQKQDASEGESRVQASKFSEKARVVSSDQHATFELSASSQSNDRRSLPPYLQSEIVRLAKQPSATLEQQQGTSSEHTVCSNNKPSIVQATLKPGVTVEPLVSARPVVKVNGHVGASQQSLDHGTAQSERGAAHSKRPTSECDGPRKPLTATRSQDAAKNAQMSSIGTRDILMDEIRNFGGKGSLRKVSTEPAWQLNVCGLRSA
ncbi:uncharacterized protein LOC144170294 isoform X3 [Haemaphysalis longicornis]